MASKLDGLMAKIQKKANEEVSEAVGTFRSEVAAAVKNLFASEGATTENTRLVLSNLVGKKEDARWPVELWQIRRNKIESEILRSMDIVQRTLVARDEKPDDPKPIE